MEELTKNKLLSEEINCLKTVIDYIEKIDVDNMTHLEAVLINILTGKTFVKNSWSDDAKARLQTYYYNNKLITQDGDSISGKVSTIKIDSGETYSIYKGNYKSLLDGHNEKFNRLVELEKELSPFYKKVAEYQKLKVDLNLE